ncbi:uncharacterized protein METZ01_LOCUS291102, partial [marine metagenome]
MKLPLTILTLCSVAFAVRADTT